MALGPLGLVDVDDPPPSLALPVIQFAEEYFRVPSGERAGDRLTFSVEQIEFLIAWFQVSSDGRHYVRRRGMLEGPKGYSKSPIGAVCGLWDLVGDVLPDGLNADRQPVGRPHPRPRVAIFAPSLDSTDNLFMQLHDAIEDSPVIDDYAIDLGLTRIARRTGGGILEPRTSSPDSAEGDPISAYYREETHLWTPANGGIKLASTINRNARKGSARGLDLTNCFRRNRGSVAEEFVRAAEAGRERVLLVRVRASTPVPDIHDTPVARQALLEIYGSHAKQNGGWVDVDELLDDRPPGETTEADWRLFYLNEETDEANDVLDSKLWALQERPGAELAAGDVIALGFDGSDKRDATALYAVRWPDWTLFKLGVWQRMDPDTGEIAKNWRVPRREVRRVIDRTVRLYRVVGGKADPRGWETDLDEIAAKHGDHVLERFPHHSPSKIGPAAARFSTMLESGQLFHDGDLTFARHAANASKEVIGPAKSGWWRPVRKKDGWPIDAFSAGISAVDALADAIADGKLNGDDDDGEDFAELI